MECGCPQAIMDIANFYENWRGGYKAQVKTDYYKQLYEKRF
jgi:hypothetical protein